MKYPRARLIQFARYPERGRVKTRLSPALGDDRILRLHLQLVRHTNTVLTASRLAPVAFWYAGDRPVAPDDPFLGSLSADAFVRQEGTDLGDRMHRAFTRTLMPEGAAEFAVLVGSDCPFLDRQLLAEGMDALSAGADLVLGPAEDGGYYLIGLRRPHAALFDDIHWGGADVRRQTLARADRAGLEYHTLKKLADIDYPEDIPKLTKSPAFSWIIN